MLCRKLSLSYNSYRSISPTDLFCYIFEIDGVALYIVIYNDKRDVKAENVYEKEGKDLSFHLT